MTVPLLTIVIPTWNRAECLSLLLRTLEGETEGTNGQVCVIVGDNASTDATPQVTREYAGRIPGLQVLRHERNVGADENFCRCLERVSTRFFWIIGDDDLPKEGVVRSVLTLLRRHDPDLLQLGSEWRPQLTGPADGTPAGDLTAVRLGSRAFARRVNVWVTFISGMVVNLERLQRLDPAPSLRRFSGTSLVQLGWVLPLVMSGRHLFVVPQRCILATSGNTGGYKLISVFATNLPAILDSVCGRASAQRNAVVRMLSWSYVPSLLWLTRSDQAGAFAPEDVRSALEPLRPSPAYWLLMLPILKLPRAIAWAFWVVARICGRALGFMARAGARGTDGLDSARPDRSPTAHP